MGFDRSADARDVQYVGTPTFDVAKGIEMTNSAMYALIPDSTDFDFTGDFTIEMFGVEFSNVGTNKTLLSKGGGSPNWSWYLIKGTSGASGLEFDWSFNGTSINALQGSFTPSVDTPYDITVDRSDANLRLYLDGAQIAKDAAASGTYNNSADDLVISRLLPSSSFAAGLIRFKALRITNGVARYATDTSYTVPTLPLPVS